MHKKVSILAVALFLAFSFAFFVAQPAMAANQSIPVNNPNDFVIDSIGEPETVDPGWAYDTASGELIFNVYDTLIFFNREEIPLSGAFELHIADSYSIPDPLTYIFHIRSGVQWHNPAYGTVTPSDVEYSFERAIVMGHDPTWMLGEPLLGTLFISDYNLTDPTTALNVVNAIDAAIEVTDAAGVPTVGGQYVTFKLAIPYAPFEQILSQTWASIISQAWASLYTWNGVWPTTGAGAVTLFATYNSPATSPLDDAGNVMMGSGPYEFVHWIVGSDWKIAANDGEATDPHTTTTYYMGFPAAGASNHVRTVTEFLVPAWATRKLRFLAGDADLTVVPTGNYPEIILESNVRGSKDLPSLTGQGLFFNYAVPADAPYQPLLGGAVKGNLMGDWHMRKGFTYSLNYAQFLQDAMNGEATQPSNPIIAGIAFYDPTDPKPVYDPNLAKWHFMMAWGGSDADGNPATLGDVTPGQAWTQGVTIPVTYNTGNIPRQIAAQMWETEIESYPWGGATDIVPTSVAWATYIPLLYGDSLPTFGLGWLADFADPHNWMIPFMHPNGDFSGHQNVHYGLDPSGASSGHLTMDWDYLPGTQPAALGTAGLPLSNDYIAALIEEGVRQTAAVDRNAIYRELAKIYYDEAPSIMNMQPKGRHWELNWVAGWYYNSIYPGFYAYHRWKGLDADLNGDGTVNLLDTSQLNANWYDGTGSTSYYGRKADIMWDGRSDNPVDNAPPGPSTTDKKADTTDMDSTMYLTGDLSRVTDNSWEAFGVAAFGDGYVDILDAGRINAQWFNQMVSV